MIKAIQIQTIDKCNADCVVCPRKSVFESDEKMSLEKIEQLSKKIEDAQKQGIVRKPCRMIMQFQNEPLLDSELCKKIRIVKDYVICNLEFYTNGSLIKLREKELLEYANYIAGITYSNYGDDFKVYNQITKLNMTEKKYTEMKIAIKEIGTVIPIRSWEAWRNGKLFDFSTRAGLVKKREISEEVKGCEWIRPYNWLHIHSNGDVVLCCQDWKRETKLANVFEKTISEIINSEKYNYIMQQATGKIRSDANFICKRCKFNKEKKNE